MCAVPRSLMQVCRSSSLSNGGRDRPRSQPDVYAGTAVGEDKGPSPLKEKSSDKRQMRGSAFLAVRSTSEKPTKRLLARRTRQPSLRPSRGDQALSRKRRALALGDGLVDKARPVQATPRFPETRLERDEATPGRAALDASLVATAK